MAENKKALREVVEVNYAKRKARELEMMSDYYEGIEELLSKLNRSVALDDGSGLMHFDRDDK